MTFQKAFTCILVQLVIIALAIHIYNHYSAWTSVAIIFVSLIYWLRKTFNYIDSEVAKDREEAAARKEGFQKR